MLLPLQTFLGLLTLNIATQRLNQLPQRCQNRPELFSELINITTWTVCNTQHANHLTVSEQRKPRESLQRWMTRR